MDCSGGIPPESTPLMRYSFDMSRIWGSEQGSVPRIPRPMKMTHSESQIPLHYLYSKPDVLDCIDSTAVTKYLNREDVRAALHIPASVQAWTVCSGDVSGNYTTIYDDMAPQFEDFLSNYTVLLYNGDTDIVCPLNSAADFVSQLNLNVTSKRRTWLYNNQVAGFVDERGPLTLLTVKGSGHMVPQWRPAQAFQMITNFLAGKPQ